MIKKAAFKSIILWSGRGDLNSRHPRPEYFLENETRSYPINRNEIQGENINNDIALERGFFWCNIFKQKENQGNRGCFLGDVR